MTAKAMTIAVVEDNDLSRSLIVNTLLGLTGMDVHSYKNGQTAWADLGNGHSTDMVISDVNMPQMDGLTLLSNVKKKNPEKPCIIISGNPNYKNAAKDLGADRFLAKPFTITELLQAVQEFST
jgi:DNA-binding NtrC family response regulator